MCNAPLGYGNMERTYFDFFFFVSALPLSSKLKFPPPNTAAQDDDDDDDDDNPIRFFIMKFTPDGR